MPTLSNTALSLASLVLLCYIVRIAWHAIIVKSLAENLPGPENPTWLLGHLAVLSDPNGLSYHHKIRERYGVAAKVFGFLGDEQLYISDPAALRHILLGRKDEFMESKIFVEINKLCFGEALTAVHGTEHKRQRKALSPFFSGASLKNLAPQIVEVADQAGEAILLQLRNGATAVDILDIMWRFGIEVIGRAGLDYSFDAFDHTRRNEYAESIMGLFPALDRIRPVLPLLPLLTRIGSESFRRWVVEHIPIKSIQDVKRLIDIIDDNGREILDDRLQALASEGTDSHVDILTQLLKANVDAKADLRLSEKAILAQMNLVIFASADTTSGTLCRIFQNLALHPDIQWHLRKDIAEAHVPASLSMVEVLNDIPLLDAVINETLRCFSPLVVSNRISQLDTNIPLSKPIEGTDGEKISFVTIARHQHVIIGIENYNRDPELWGDDASKWNPNRWLRPPPASLLAARSPGVYANLLTFMGGERSCIGYNLALLEMKILVTSLLKKYSFHPADPVNWKLGAGTRYPVVEGKGTQLPLSVEVL